MYGVFTYTYGIFTYTWQKCCSPKLSVPKIKVWSTLSVFGCFRWGYPYIGSIHIAYKGTMICRGFSQLNHPTYGFSWIFLGIALTTLGSDSQHHGRDFIQQSEQGAFLRDVPNKTTQARCCWWDCYQIQFTCIILGKLPYFLNLNVSCIWGDTSLTIHHHLGWAVRQRIRFFNPFGLTPNPSNHGFHG